MKNGRPRGKDDGHVAWAFFAIDGSQIAFQSRLADWGACRASDEATCSAAIFCQRTCEIELLIGSGQLAEPAFGGPIGASRSGRNMRDKNGISPLLELV
jgi:hypothetical protein